MIHIYLLPVPDGVSIQVHNGERVEGPYDATWIGEMNTGVLPGMIESFTAGEFTVHDERA